MDDFDFTLAPLGAWLRVRGMKLGLRCTRDQYAVTLTDPSGVTSVSMGETPDAALALAIFGVQQRELARAGRVNG